MISKLPFLTKKKNPTLEYIGSNSDKDIEIQLYSYNKTDFDRGNFTPNNLHINDLFESNEYVSWLNFHGIHNSKFITDITSKLDLDYLVTQNILNTYSRPKIEIFNNLIFITLQCVYDSESDLTSEQISFILKDNNLISFQEKKGDHFGHIRERIINDLGIVRKKGSDFLLFLLLEAIVIHYNEIIYKEERSFDEINSRLLKNPSPEVLSLVELKKQKISSLKSSIFPIIEDLNILIKESTPFIKKENLKYFKDLEHRANKSIDELNEISLKIEGSINLYFSAQGHKMNEIMKTLTIVSAIFIPITFLAGIYGMNFENIPELKTQNGYFIFLAVIVLIVISLLIYFKKKKWF